MKDWGKIKEYIFQVLELMEIGPIRGDSREEIIRKKQEYNKMKKYINDSTPKIIKYKTYIFVLCITLINTIVLGHILGMEFSIVMIFIGALIIYIVEYFGSAILYFTIKAVMRGDGIAVLLTFLFMGTLFFILHKLGF